MNKKIILAFIITEIFLVACQKNETPIQKKSTDASIQGPGHSVEKEIEINEFPQDCQSVESTLSILKTKYAPERLLHLNQLFKNCLDSVPLEKRYEWMKKSSQIYNFQISKLPENISNYITKSSSDHSTLSKTELQKLEKTMNHEELFIIKKIKKIYL